MGWTFHTHGRNYKFVKKFWSENLKERDDMGDLDADGELILKWTLNEQGVKDCTGFNWLE
jgi:hypothetical protein